jgi:hypothetical protein
MDFDDLLVKRGVMEPMQWRCFVVAKMAKLVKSNFKYVKIGRRKIQPLSLPEPWRGDDCSPLEREMMNRSSGMEPR